LKCDFEDLKLILVYQSLVGSVEIGVEFVREDRGSILATAIERGLKSLDAITDPKPD
jgi:hypothetical protein